MSLGETIIYCGLEGYLYMQAAPCSLCGFNIFGMRAVFSMGACCLFPQHVLAIIPLIRVCGCSGWCPLLGSRQQLMSLLVPRRATAAMLSFEQRELWIWEAITTIQAKTVYLISQGRKSHSWEDSVFQAPAEGIAGWPPRLVEKVRKHTGLLLETVSGIWFRCLGAVPWIWGLILVI